MKRSIIVFMALILLLISGCLKVEIDKKADTKKDIRNLVFDMAKAWETGDVELLDSILHKDVVFSYPGRRLNKSQTLEDIDFFKNSFKNTKVYINKIIIEGDDVAVEWQFASTKIEDNKRTAVSDAIIGKVKDGKIILWKEYLDGRVSRMQSNGELPLEEGEEPFPWPNKIQK
jgi:ketosteroid isomerase-like protein